MSSLSPRYAPKTLMRLADIEDALAAGKSEGRVMHEMSEQHQLSPRQCRRLMALARARWAREASAAGRDQRRNQLRVAAWTTYRAAMGRERGFATRRWDADAQEMVDEVVRVADPDAGAAVRALEFVARLDGDLTQPNAGIVVGFGDEAMRAIAQIYGTGQAPDLPPELEAEVIEPAKLTDGGDDG